MDHLTDDERAAYNLSQRETFNRAVGMFDRPLPHEIVGRLKEIVAAAELKPGTAVLDVGTGTGALIDPILAYNPGRVAACDLSPRMLARLGELHPRVERILGDVTDLDLPDQSFDAVFMNAVFSNIADKPAALANTARMLKDGGRLVVGHPEGRGFITKLKAHLPFEIDPLPDEAQWRQILAPHPLEPGYFLDDPTQYVAVAVRNKR